MDLPSGQGRTGGSWRSLSPERNWSLGPRSPIPLLTSFGVGAGIFVLGLKKNKTKHPYFSFCFNK